VGILVVFLLAPLAYLVEFVPHIGSKAICRNLVPCGRELGLLVRTFLLGICVTLVSFAFGVGPAILCSRTRSRWRPLFLLFAVATLLVPPYILCYTWMVSTGPHGMLAGWWSLPGGKGDVTGFLPTVLVLGLWLWPVWTLILQAALGALQTEMEEAGLLEATRARVALKVTAPAVGGHALAAAAVVFVLASSNYSVGHLLGMPLYTTELLGAFHVSEDHRQVAATAFPYAAVLVVVVWWVSRYERSALGRLLGAGASGRRSPIIFGPKALLAVSTAVVAASLGVPVVTMVRTVAGDMNSLATLLRPLAGQMGRTVVVSSLGATAVAAVAMPAAVFSVWRPTARTLIGLAGLVTFAVPGVLVGMGLVRLYNRPGPAGWVYSSVAIIVIGLFVRFLFVGWRIQLAAFERIGSDLVDAARVMGANGRQLATRVFWPMAWPAVAAGWVLVFVLCTGELSIVMSVSPPGWSLLSGSILNLMHYGRDEATMGACLAMVCASMAAASLLLVVRRRAFGRELPAGGVK